jgi:hypothetical protein
MRITANSSNHMNIVASRKSAVRKMTRRTGLTFSFNGEKLTKCLTIRMVTNGLFDGYFYTVDFDAETVKIMSHRDSFGCESFLFRIGN